MARGLVIDDATIGLVWDGVEGSGKYALDVTGSAALLGVDDVLLGGTVRVRYNGYGATVDRTIAIGTDQVVVRFTSSTAVAEVTGTGLTLGVLGQSLSGDLVVTHDATGLTLEVENLAATLAAGGTTYLRLTEGAGTLRVTAAGLALGGGTPLTGTVALTVPGVTLTGDYSLALDTTGVSPTFAFTATNASLQGAGRDGRRDVHLRPSRGRRRRREHAHGRRRNRHDRHRRQLPDDAPVARERRRHPGRRTGRHHGWIPGRRRRRRDRGSACPAPWT